MKLFLFIAMLIALMFGIAGAILFLLAHIGWATALCVLWCALWVMFFVWWWSK